MARSWRELTVAAAVLALTAACVNPGEAGGTDEATGGDGKPASSVAFFGFAKANSFTMATFDGVKEYAEDNGATAEFFDPDFDAQKQVQQIQDAVTAKRHGVFVVQANDGTAVVPAIRSAVKAGVTVVVQFTPVGTRYDTAEPQVPGTISIVDVPVNNGATLGRLGVSACRSRDLDPCRVAYLEGLKALPLDNARTGAVIRTLKAADGVDVVAQVEGGYTKEDGRAAMQDVLQANPGVHVVIGSSQAIFGAGGVARDKEILFIGNGASRQAVKAVKEGRWYAIAYLPVKTAGAKAAELGLKKARGEDVPETVDLATLAPAGGEGTKEALADVTGEYDE